MPAATRSDQSSRSQLEQRVAHLERELATSRSNGALFSSTSSNAEATNGPLPGNDLPLELSDEEAAVDTLATTVFSHEPEVSIGHFGPSSNHGYFRALSHIFARLPEDGRAADPKSLHHWSRYRHASTSGASQEGLRDEACNPAIVPEASTAMHLFNQFFVCMSLLHPYISRAEVLQSYNGTHGQSTQSLGPIRKALLNILWAHGATAACRNDGEVFYRRSLRCLNNLTIREAGNELGKLHP